MEIHIKDSYIGERVDAVLTELLKGKGLSRNIIQRYMKEGCTVNRQNCKRSYHLKEGDTLVVDDEYWNNVVKDIDLSNDIIPQEGDLDIRYENDNLLVLFKPKGLVVHPGVGNRKDTLANYIRYYLEQQGKYDSLLDRAGIVHRLDKGVSGLMVVAKNKETQEYLKNQFKERTVIKIYRAKLNECKEVERNLNIEKYIQEMNIKVEPWKDWKKVEGYIGRSPRDRYRMEFKRYQFSGSKYALTYVFFIGDEALIKIDTGRMHQIRVTMEFLGYHIKGDKLYGKGNTDDKIMLEAVLLSFLDTENNRLTFKA